MAKHNKKNASQANVEENSTGGFKFSWLLWGAAAYYGLRYLNKRGILPAQTGKAFDWIDSGIDVVKQRAGIGASSNQASVNH